MDEKINLLTLPTNGGQDATTAMAMMNNNPWMYLVMLALFGNGAFGNNNGRGNSAEYMALSGQMNDNNNNQWAREAVQGNGYAISQLAQNLNVDVNTLREAINTVNFSIANLGSQTGMGFAGVTNAINLGNLNIIQQLKDCCCTTQKQILEQGYQGRIETINQTNDLQTSIRVENGLVRAEVAAFRQAWEASRYQDVVAEKTRLQTELDLLRSQQGTAAMIAPVQAEVGKLQMQMQQFFNTYGGGSSKSGTTGGNA